VIPVTPSSLALVATPIGNLGDMSARAVATLRAASLICCEDTRHSGKLMAHFGISGVRLAVCNEHTEHARIAEVLSILAEGGIVALVTDAGTPGISDPGMRLARAVIDQRYPVTAVPGADACTMALVISGFDTTRFVFEGFIPRSGRARTDRLADIAAERRTTVLYEAPHRVATTIDDLFTACGPARRVAVCRELTKLHEEVWRGTLAAAQEAHAVREPRGEYAIVVEGAPAPPPPTQDDVDERLRAALADGLSRKSAAAFVAEQLDLAKRDVYERSLTIDR
jgi:16S rRNA (cytidine1402-2'-O)-methyltransferase